MSKEHNEKLQEVLKIALLALHKISDNIEPDLDPKQVASEALRKTDALLLDIIKS